MILARGPSLEYAQWLCSLLLTEHGVQLALIGLVALAVFRVIAGTWNLKGE